jgi:hypothetical protein
MMARLAFVIAFEHFVFAVTSVIMWLIPDVPSDIAIKMRREEYRVGGNARTRTYTVWGALEHRLTACFFSLHPAHF